MIRLANAGDLPAVAALYEAVLDREEAVGRHYTNWKRGAYPTRATAEEALAAGTLYVGEDDRLWGAVILNGDQLPEYGTVPWADPAESGRVAVLHTLCIHPDREGRGLGRRLVAFCEGESRRRGCRVLRLDTWSGNAPANRLYPTLGFRFAGAVEVVFRGMLHETLNCYEKPL